MARGWESKSVESQQEAAEARKAEKPPLSDAEQKILALEHTRKHILDEMEASRNPRFRELKSKALAFVEGQIANLRGRESTAEQSDARNPAS